MPSDRGRHFARFSVKLQKKVMVELMRGVGFGQAGKQAVRFCFASSEDNIREAARRLGEHLGSRR